jgi:imidazolonepropionase
MKQRPRKNTKNASSKPRLKSKPNLRASPILILRNISSLLTLEGVARKDGRHITAEDLSVSQDAAIVIQDEKIIWTGASKKIPKDYSVTAAEMISLKGKTVLPAFVECHTHSVFAGTRAAEFERRLAGESYSSIAASGGGILSTVTATREASLANLKKMAATRLTSFVNQGVTTVEIKSGYGLTIQSELKMLRAAKLAAASVGLRSRLTFLGPHAVPPEFLIETGGAKVNQKNGQEFWVNELVKSGLDQVKRQGLASRVDIFIEAGFFSNESGRKYLTKAKELGFDLVVHAEQLSRTGSAQLAVELGARSVDHVIHINENDIKELAASQTTAVLLPLADLYMQCAYPPARALIDRGARVAIATDFNPGSCPSQDLAMVGLLSRLQMKMTLPEVIAGYSYNAAAALGLENDIGALTPGRFADLVVLDSDWTELFYSAGSMHVERVMSAGRWLK